MRRATAVVVAAVAVVATSCGSPGPPRYPTLAAVTEAALARLHADVSWYGTSTDSIVMNGRVVRSSSGTGEARLGPGGAAQHGRTEGQMNGAPWSDETIVLPDATYTLIPKEMRAPDGPRYLKHDPYATDPLSLSAAAYVRTARAMGTRLYCYTELGTAELTGAAPAERDGTPVMRYAITVDLTRGTTQPLATAQFRLYGLTQLHVALDLDAADRVLGCRVDEEFPGGLGSFHSDARWFGYGTPVEISAPPPDQVTTVPPRPPG